MDDFKITYPEATVFETEGIPKKVSDIGPVHGYLFDHAEYPEQGEILLFKQGLLFPTKGFVFPQAIQCVKVAKATLISTIYLLKNHGKASLVTFLLGNRLKALEEALAHFNGVIIPVVKPITPQEKYLIYPAQELGKIIKNFLTELGITEVTAAQFSLIIAAIFNYDNAYHFRLVDICSEVSKEKLLKQPIRELLRVLNIYNKRELLKRPKKKIKLILPPFLALLTSHKFKKAFLKAIEQADWSKLTYDKIWRYNVLERGDYNFMGLDYETRFEIFSVLHDFKLPRQIRVT